MDALCVIINLGLELLTWKYIKKSNIRIIIVDPRPKSMVFTHKVGKTTEVRNRWKGMCCFQNKTSHHRHGYITNPF